ncbi:hypothetical protein BURPSS13_I0644 [Burkholderia pseudomallei S13]|nr:hypothetical protein BURPSS13_I0644 [Burkholderia pseudomallei S13]
MRDAHREPPGGKSVDDGRARESQPFAARRRSSGGVRRPASCRTYARRLAVRRRRAFFPARLDRADPVASATVLPLRGGALLRRCSIAA